MPAGPSRLRFLLRAEHDADQYERGWRSGSAPDRLPYGIEHEPAGWRFEVARRHASSRVTGFAIRAVRRAAGFDLLHAWMNRRFLNTAEVVYCHSEVEYLGAAAVLLLLRNRSTRLIGQTIWLFHGFMELPGWRRALLRRLLSRVDVFVYNAAPNELIGRQLMPDAHHEYVPFGVSPLFREQCEAVDAWDVLSVGNDVSRDWEALRLAVAGLGVRCRVATDGKHLVLPDASIRRTDSVAELRGLYAGAGVVVIAVHPNSHASGITSLLEAAASGTAVVATRTGGLDRYFEDDEVRFVDPDSPDQLRTAITALLDDPAAADLLGERMRARFDASGYSNVDYWRRITAVVDAMGPDRRDRRRRTPR